MYGLLTTEHFAITLFLGLLGLAVVTDLAELRIPNRICLLIALLYPCHVLASPEPVNWAGALAVAAGVFVIGLIPFSAGVMGGGDVKLMAATALWAGPSLVVDFLLLTTLVGGALALLMVTRHRFALANLLDSVGAMDLRDVLLGRAIPYGTAIAAGAYITLAPALLGH
jgi:prepilin peptidase CpaA